MEAKVQLTVQGTIRCNATSLRSVESTAFVRCSQRQSNALYHDDPCVQAMKSNRSVGRRNRRSCSRGSHSSCQPKPHGEGLIIVVLNWEFWFVKNPRVRVRLIVFGGQAIGPNDAPRDAWFPTPSRRRNEAATATMTGWPNVWPSQKLSCSR